MKNLPLYDDANTGLRMDLSHFQWVARACHELQVWRHQQKRRRFRLL